MWHDMQLHAQVQHVCWVGVKGQSLVQSSPELCVGAVDTLNTPANHADHVVDGEVVIVLCKDAVLVPGTLTKTSEDRPIVQTPRVTPPQNRLCRQSTGAP